MKKEFWHFLVNGKHDHEFGAFANFYVYGLHCGDAMEGTIHFAETNAVTDAEIVEATCLDQFEDYEPPNVIQIGEDAFMLNSLSLYPIEDTYSSFKAPIGIIKSNEDGEYDYELIKEAFAAYDKDENGIYVFELVADRSNFLDTFLKTIDFLPSVDGFWIYIADHWEDSKTQLWVSKDITDKRDVIDFLLEQKGNTIESGYVNCVVHCIAGETNLKICEHKKIHLHTKDKNLFEDFGFKIMELGYKQTKELYNLEFDYHHYHYRPANSLNRDEFVEMLKSKNFELLDESE